MDENKPTCIVSHITESELLYIMRHYGFITPTPEWVYREAREHVVLDGLMAQKRL